MSKNTSNIVVKRGGKSAENALPVVNQDNNNDEKTKPKGRGRAKKTPQTETVPETETATETQTESELTPNTGNTTNTSEETEEIPRTHETKRKGIPGDLEPELKFRSALAKLRSEISTQTEILKGLKNGFKRLESSYEHDINKAVKTKRKRNGPVKATGFVKELDLPKELAELINVPEGTKISMPTYTKKFYEMLKKNNLFYENDGRVLRANDQIKKVFNLPDSVNNSIDYKDKNGFNFYTLQKHIATVNKNVKETKNQANVVSNQK